MAKPKFYLEPRPSANGKQAINMFYSFNGNRLQYYTGIRIEIKDFRPECNSSNKIKPIKSTAPFAEQYNNRLSDIAINAVSIVNDAKGKNLTVKYVREQLDSIYKPQNAPEKEIKKDQTLLSLFSKIIEESKSGKRLITTGKNKGSRYSYNAIKNYGTSRSAITRYLKHIGQKDISLQYVNASFYEDFKNFCYEVEKKEVSTFAGYIKDIKTVMGITDSTTFKKKDFMLPNYEADTIALTLDQLDVIHNLDLSDKPRLDNIRDLFLLGCYSGLRFSDFSNLSIESIENGFIRVKQIKTGARVTIPVMQRMQKVLDKYNGNLPKVVTNQEFNRVIKEVVLLAGINYSIPVKNTKGNKVSHTNIEIYKLVSSHTARRSYATTMFKAGVPPMLIMSATGHKTESSFLKYIRATNEDKAKLLAHTLQQLGL